jgi:tRNA pseudouridine55 synthase
MSDALNGIVVVDKPEGISSAKVVARVKAILGAKKVGHAGTLDPFATGVLVCCINQATRLSRFLLCGDKTYEAELVLGVATDTQDATGTVIQRGSLNHVSEKNVRETAARFVGPIAQTPPVYSALKHRGTPLYKLARRGMAVEKPARPVQIHRLEIREINLPTVRFEVSCSAGTYVRTLCADMGRELGCGGHLRRLRRTASGKFSIGEAVGLEKLAESRDLNRLEQTVIPMSDVLPFMPAATADEATLKKVQHGMPLSTSDFAVLPDLSAEGVFKVIDPGGRLIAVLQASSTADHYNYCCVFSA